MAKVYSEDFKREAVRIALTSGLRRKDVASDLCVGKSSLCALISTYGPEETGAAPEGDMLRELERLRKENRVLKEEREVLN